MKRPEWKRLSRDHVLMETAHLFAQRSTCDRNAVGVVIAREGRILMTGYNGSPSGLPHCGAGRCDPSVACTWATHAEQNAIAYAARCGVALVDASMYVTVSPCLACARSIITAGIGEVVYYEAYRDPAGIDLLREAGVSVISSKERG